MGGSVGRFMLQNYKKNSQHNTILSIFDSNLSFFSYFCTQQAYKYETIISHSPLLLLRPPSPQHPYSITPRPISCADRTHISACQDPGLFRGKLMGGAGKRKSQGKVRSKSGEIRCSAMAIHDTPQYERPIFVKISIAASLFSFFFTNLNKKIHFLCSFFFCFIKNAYICTVSTPNGVFGHRAGCPNEGD